MITLPQTQQVGNPQVHASPPAPKQPKKSNRMRLVILVLILVTISVITVLLAKALIEREEKEGMPFALSFITNTLHIFTTKKTDTKTDSKADTKKEEAKSGFPIAVRPITPTPTPRPLPQGKIPFEIQTSKKPGPKFIQGYIDPYDPKPKEKQTMTVYVVKSDKPVTNKTVTIKSDHDLTTYPFEVQSQIENQEIWSASWIVSDTHKYTYVAIIEAANADGASRTEIMLR
jgi:hypothetical protein